MSLDPTLVRDVLWWESPEFSDSTRLEAAERIAFEKLDPILRSRGATREASRLLAADEACRARVLALIDLDQPSDKLVLPSFDGLVDRVQRLEDRLADLESRLPPA